MAFKPAQSDKLLAMANGYINGTVINWMIGNHLPELDLSASYLKLMQFIVVCHLHWTVATRILHKEKLVIRVIVPILVLYFIYFTSMTVIGILSVKSSWVECLEPDWIMLSIVEFLVVQLFMLAGIYITKKINAVSTVDSFKRAQKRDLWSVIAAFEVSALVSVIYDITMLILGSEAMSCSAIFGHMQLVYSPIFALFMILKLMLPIWVMLCVFHPVPLMIVDPETVLGWSFEGTAPTSVFSPAHRERSIYKQLEHPGTNSGQTDQTIIIEQPLSRSQTTPAFFSGFLKRGGQQTSLAPIREEGEATIVVVTQPTPCPDKPPERGPDEQPLLNSGSSRTTESSSVSE
uniref:Transmembrane protein n=1 Tax=Strigamia maritima TaxID=126957 RepID=T1IQ11_STRMM